MVRRLWWGKVVHKYVQDFVKLHLSDKLNVEIEPELKLKLPEGFEIVGRPDLLIHGEEKVYVIEIKSVWKDDFRKQDVFTRRDWLKQIRYYTCLADLSFNKEAIGVLLVVTQSGNIFEYVYDVVTKSDIEDMKRRAYMLRTCILNDIVPDREVNPTCSECLYRHICFGGGYVGGEEEKE